MAKSDKTPGSEVAVAETPAAGSQALEAYGAYADYAGSGFENQTQDDYSIPFLTILQALSPQLQPGADRDDLKQGMIFNTVTGEAFPGNKGLAFIPATTMHEFIEFKPRDAGGGFVGRHAIDSQVVKDAQKASTDFGKYNTPDGNELIETFAVYGVAITDAGDTIDAVVAFSSAKIKKYKAWMTKAKTVQIPLPDGRRIPAPLFAHRYRLKTVGEKNNKGSFFNWDIAFDGANAVEARLLPSDALFQAAVALKGLLDSGAARAAYETQAPAGDDEAGAAPAGKPVF